MNEMQHINQGIGLIVGIVFPAIVLILAVAYWLKTRGKDDDWVD